MPLVPQFQMVCRKLGRNSPVYKHRANGYYTLSPHNADAVVVKGMSALSENSMAKIRAHREINFPYTQGEIRWEFVQTV